ncbi:MAG: hypothetical protein WDZ81_01400 [Candidatus Saccharimonadales bacterium]
MKKTYAILVSALGFLGTWTYLVQEKGENNLFLVPAIAIAIALFLFALVATEEWILGGTTPPEGSESYRRQVISRLTWGVLFTLASLASIAVLG